MIFDNMELMDEFEVQIYDDPYDILSNAMRLRMGAEKIIRKEEAGGLEDKNPVYACGYILQNKTERNSWQRKVA